MVHNRKLSRRQILRSAVAMGGVAVGSQVLSACSSPRQESNAQSGKSGQGGETLTIGFVPIACASPLVAADGLGAFSKQGLNVELRKFVGWADLWTAYATGALDVAHMLSPMPLAIDAGATNASRPTELAFTQNTNGQALTLSTSHLDTVSRPADLKGMVLGIPFEYSVHALLLRDYLVAGGIDPVSDVELRLLRPADMVAQLSVGTIDGFIGPEPFNQRALTTGSGRAFVPTRQMWDNHPCCSVAVAKEVDRGVRDRVVAALQEGAQYGLSAVQTFRKDGEDETEFMTISYWPDFDAMTGFSGGDPAEIHHLPRDPEYLIELPSSVEILDLRVDAGQP